MAFTAAPLPSLGLLLDQDTADAGVFSVNRSDAPAQYTTKLLVGRRLVAAVGSYALNGQDATTTKDTPTAWAAAPLPAFAFLDLFSATERVLVAEFGTFSYRRSDNPSLSATMLRKGRAMFADAGTFTVTVAPATRDMEMNGDHRQVTVIGRDAGLTATRYMTAAVGTYALNGQEAGVVSDTPAARVMPASVGIFAMSRSDNPSLGATRFVRGAALTAEYGVYSFSGQSATLTGPTWRDVAGGSGSWVYVTPSGGVWTDVDPDS